MFVTSRQQVIQTLVGNGPVIMVVGCPKQTADPIEPILPNKPRGVHMVDDAAS
jgi:hypothetical protein